VIARSQVDDDITPFIVGEIDDVGPATLNLAHVVATTRSQSLDDPPTERPRRTGDEHHLLGTRRRPARSVTHLVGDVDRHGEGR
jgi:hypothetical protein